MLLPRCAARRFAVVLLTRSPKGPVLLCPADTGDRFVLLSQDDGIVLRG